ncbi:membrane-bound lytic murein transglycosylase MltF [Motiliproteus coralliicola]|uniref:Membrane-bound lytic murein transglycosylase F n=1 Tax=Motiliproteus coralliicola TaxID=2283196 RepID=A0A369WJI2_9GAMM|nr:membrane-bound lytic murein transglycosylase MltF [Motiliproteus coralliicola]RDE19605.1 membrane-bound lytic murein transglycosylase MltF [Motiliproteus coralliicola]
MRKALIRKLPLLIGAGIALSFVPVISEYNPQSQLDSILERKQLRVISRLSPTTYYLEDGRPGGFEFELSQAYADYLGVELELLPSSSIQDIWNALRLNNAQLAAAGLALTDDRTSRFDFGPGYLTSKVFLIYRSGDGHKPPKSLEEVSEPIHVIADSSHAEYLAKLDPQPPWIEAQPGVELLDLIQQIDRGEIQYALVDAEAFEVSRALFPRLKAAFALDHPQVSVWWLKRSADSSLQQSLIDFFEQPSTQDLIQDLKERHFEIDHRLGLVDNLTFRQHLKSRFPKLKAWLIEAAAQHQIEWELLAAIAYQESHWNPKAVSPTGVRGIMMLTQNTARAMGVTKRTDPKQSIFGGARYFAEQFQRIPERIQGEDRLWFALASYNVGRGHLEDARVLSQQAGDNPDRWEDVAKHLPKLAQPRWYNKVKHGFARGYEPVQYVQNIRRYQTMLQLESRHEAIQEMMAVPEIMGPPAPSAGTDLENTPQTL